MNALPHEPALRGWLAQRRVVGCEADDVVQDAYAVLAAMADVSHIREPRAYLLSIGHSLLMRRVRHARSTRFESTDESGVMALASDEASPERHVTAQHELRRMQQLLDALPAKCRQAFTLRKMEGLSQREIAQRMGVSENTVEKHVGKGLRILSQSLGRIVLVTIVGLGLLDEIRAADAKCPVSHRSALTGMLLRDDVTANVVQSVSGDRIKQSLTRISLHDRSGLTPGFNEAVEEVGALARQAGLSDVIIERFASDGVVKYFDIPSQRLWAVRRAELWVTEPMRIRVTSYDELPMSLAHNSTSAQVTTELINVGRGDRRDDYEGKDVKGKIVLVSAAPAAVADLAAEHGAAGIVSSFSARIFERDNRLPGDFRDQVGWFRLSEQQAIERGGFAFLISERRAAELKELLASGPVVMKAGVDAELKAGELLSVSGVIPGGGESPREILFTAHLDHYRAGANDNASGSAALLEIARVWHELIETNQLPRPAATLRFLWIREHHGTRAWLARHINDPVERLANFNVDMVGGTPQLTNSRMLATAAPHAKPSYMDALVDATFDFLTRFNQHRYAIRKDLQSVALTGSRQPFVGRLTPFQFGGDHEFFAMLGVPSTIYFTWPDDYYHTSQDTPDKIDATQLGRAALAAMLPAMTLAYMDESHASDLALLVAAHGQRRIAEGRDDILRRLADCGTLGLRVPEARLTLRHAVERETRAVESVLRFASGASETARVRSIARSIGAGSTSLDKALSSYAVACPGDDQDATSNVRAAERLVPVRNPGQEVTPAERTIGFGPVVGGPDRYPRVGEAVANAVRLRMERGATLPTALSILELPALYVDGRRSVRDIQQRVQSEAGVSFALDAMLEYFEAMQALGVMTLQRR